ncbi:DUF6517 family protein [Halobacteria archaeon AArc-m2/3/4]|uniref:DUF6517 family protein n=1 Tax=Natronoglomus mannanivorans TaxID=2979990 RepID=A0AAP2YWX1_9EURY|nr:DUF6517 family protein [Halobacteria archaeon AArc-xg1-1]MCU4971387.1 DUF6517 family protein [Halobacteria archaeon AArc-m2/3/4]
MHRRRFLGGLATVGLVASAGCVDRILGNFTSYTATPAAVSDAAIEETGYEHQETEEEVEEEDVAGETVEITNYISRYSRTVDIPLVGETEAGVFATITTPQVSVAGENYNPVGEMNNREIIALVQEQYDELSIGDSVDNRSVDTLGTTTNVETFEGEATVRDTNVDVFVDVSRFEHGDDHVIVGGVYPEQLSDEAERMTRLIEGLEHEG